MHEIVKRVKRIWVLGLMTLLPITGYAQVQSVSGKVTESDGVTPLPGVTIVEKGTTNGVITNMDGEYVINLQTPDAVLLFSMIGMDDLEQKVTSSVMNVSLVSALLELEQVVVTGYSTQRKADLTGAVSVVKVDDMMKSPDNNPMKALQGRVAGMMVTSDGSPKGNATIRIRGVGTLNNNDPLYIIDGVPTKSGMHELNSNDIESIQVLRDASAASIYGSRAANGVIIVTTKKGEKGQTRVNFDAYLTSSWYSNKMEVLNTEQYGQAMWQAYVNGGANPNSNNIGYSFDWGYDEAGVPVLNKILLPEYIDAARTMRPSNTDWFNAVTRQSLMQSYNLSLSNGTDNGNYFFSLGYLDSEGIIKNSDFSRVSARMNTDFNLLDGMLTIGENFTINMTEELEAPGGILNAALQALPLVPIHTEDGGWGGPAGGMNDRHNPVRVLEANKDNRYRYWRTFGNVFANLEPVKGLNIRSSFGIDYGNFYKRHLTRSYQSGYLKNDLSAVSMDQGHWLKWTWSNTANYKFEIGKSHFDILGGMEHFRENNINFSAYKEDFELESVDFMWPDVGTGRANATGASTGYSLLSYFGKVNYDYDSRYLASATIRYDGSSRFGKNNRFGTFPAFSLGWRISQEAFMDNLSGVFSDLKLRYGWGQTGNQEISNTAIYNIYVPDYGVADPTWETVRGTAYDIDGNGGGMLPSGFRLVQRGNDDLKWETTTQSNIGLDFGLFQQAVYGSFEYFIKETDDILVMPPYLAAIGEGGERWLNGASMENKGFESSLGYRKSTYGGFSYDISANISSYRNKVTHLPEDVQNAYGGDGDQDNILGRPLGSMYGYVADGIFKSNEEVSQHALQDGKGLGRIRYKDLNDDGEITSEDRAWIGSPHPDFIWGLNINLEYKNFDLSVFFQGVQNIDANVHDMKGNTDFWSVWETGSNKGTRLLDAWSPSNPGSDIPALQSTDINWEQRFSTYYVEDVSYLKLRIIQLGYSLPRALSQRIKMERMRFYVTGQNLLTITSKNFSGVDPETPGFGYPIPASFTLGLNVSF